MKPAVDIPRLAELAFAQVLAAEPRTPERRAAVCLYYAATVPPAKSLRAIKNAIGTFGEDEAQADALSLLDQLARQHQAQAAGAAGPVRPEGTS